MKKTVDRKTVVIWTGGFLVALVVAVPVWADPGPGLGALAVPFEANQGQLAPAVAYAAQTFYGTTFVTRDGELVHALAAPHAVAADRQGDSPAGTGSVPTGPGWNLVERFVDGADLEPRGEGPSPTLVSRFIGSDPSRWRRGVATYRGVNLGRPWPGIRVEVQAHGSNVEKIFTVDPGADPGRIEVGIEGALALRLGAAGDLVAETGNGPVRFRAPLAYQWIDGERRAVAVRYALVGDNAYSFTVGDHEADRPLTIDPLLQSTYLGGSREEFPFDVVADGSGGVIVVGSTRSGDFPVTVGAAQTSYAGGFSDVFVARLSADLGTLEQVTFLGGGDLDEARSVVIDRSGTVIVAGRTASMDFPGTTGSVQPSRGGGSDAFVARLTPDLGTLEEATYLGGGQTDEAAAVALDGGGDVVIAGVTQSSDFPGLSGGYQTTLNSFADAFVARLAPDLTALDQATYLGGRSEAQVSGMGIDGAGHVIVVGLTQSTDFPGTTGGAQASPGGALDGFAARLSADLSILDQATYLGGNGSEYLQALAVDGSGNLVVMGYTGSTDLPAPAAPNRASPAVARTPSSPA